MGHATLVDGVIIEVDLMSNHDVGSARHLQNFHQPYR